MTTKYTLLDGLAHVAITGWMSGLGSSTRTALIEHTRLRAEMGDGGLYELTEHASELVRQSRHWKAHLHLTEELGMQLRRDRRATKRFKSYHDPENPDRRSFVSNGNVYVENPETRRTELVRSFRNG